MELNIDKLIQRSEQLGQEMLECIKHETLAEDVLRDARANWESAYAEFLDQEGNGLTPPAGGRWNDDKRKAYVQTNWPVAWESYRSAEAELRKAHRDTLSVSEEISTLNRYLRILQIAVSDDSNAIAMTVNGIVLQR